MTAHRPRQPGSRDEAGFMDVLFYGATNPRAGRQGRVWVPPTDVYETDDAIVVLVEIAGVRQAELSVSLHDRRLIISGARFDRGPASRAYHQMEVHFGEFRADVDLPTLVDERQIDAEYSDGFLRVVLPKQKPRAIDIQE